MLLQGKPISWIQCVTAVSTGDFYRINDAHLNNNQEALKKLLDSEKHTAGSLRTFLGMLNGEFARAFRKRLQQDSPSTLT